MNIHNSRVVFENFLALKGLTLERISPPEGFDSILSFYREERSETPLCEDGDMLLFQWGKYDWGDGHFFTMNLARQFIVPLEGEQEVWQLSLTFKYEPSDELSDLGRGNKWCPDAEPDTIREFREFIWGTKAFNSTGALKPLEIELDYFNVC